MSSAHPQFTGLRNLGPRSAAMLQAAGVRSEAQLRRLGAVAAFVAVRRAGLKPSLNLLWALEGALSDRDWRLVSHHERTRLLMQLEDFDRGPPC